MALSYEEAKAALVTWKLTGQFTRGMVVMVGYPFPIHKATVHCDDGLELVEVNVEFAGRTTLVRRSQLRPIMLK